MFTDLLHLSRGFRRSPGSVSAAVLTLALTLGAGGAIVAVVDAVLLAPLPFQDPDALAIAGETPIDGAAEAPRAVSYARFEAWRARAASLAALEAFDATNFTLTGTGSAERVSVTDATPGLLTLLGVAPLLGRGFEAQDVARPVAMVSESFWRRKLSADPGAIGRQIVLGGQAHTIVAVLPKQFVFDLNASDIWRPLPLPSAEAARRGYPVHVIARLAPDVPAPALAAALDDVSRSASVPSRAVAIPLATAIAGDKTRTLGLLAAAAGLGVAIAFINFAGLLVVRSIDRRRELAVRTALGASRSDIFRHLLLESQALVAGGVVGGVLLAVWITPVVGRLALEQSSAVPREAIAVSWRVIAAVALAASACAWIAALLPARVAARRDVLDVLRRGATPPPRELAARRVIVTAEVALAFVLLACLTLVGGSLRRLLQDDGGFDAPGVLTLQVALPASSYTDARTRSFYAELHHALEARLGGGAIAMVSEIPLTGDRGRRLVSEVPGDVGREAVVRQASPAYFDVMRVPILAGRTFASTEEPSAPARIVISAALKDRLFGAVDPLGRRIRVTPGPRAAEIIGVVGDVKHRALDEAVLPTLYLSTLQFPSRSAILVVRSPRPDADVIAAVREETARLDGNVPIYRVRSMQEVVAASPGMPARRVATATLLGFALVALALGALGLFGAVAHDVASRRHELALRIALGADPMRIVSAILRRSAVMVGAGLATGVLLSIGAARTLHGVGFVTSRFDVLAFALPAALLIAAGAAAVLPAARRAARTDPLMALRSE